MHTLGFWQNRIVQGHELSTIFRNSLLHYGICNISVPSLIFDCVHLSMLQCKSSLFLIFHPALQNMSSIRGSERVNVQLFQ